MGFGYSNPSVSAFQEIVLTVSVFKTSADEKETRIRWHFCYLGTWYVLFCLFLFWECDMGNHHMYPVRRCRIPQSRATYRRQSRKHHQSGRSRADYLCSQAGRELTRTEQDPVDQGTSWSYHSVSQKILNKRQDFWEENVKVRARVPTECVRIKNKMAF